MHFLQSLMIGIPAALASSSTPGDGGYCAVLLKRQAPGTPEYNCHDNCGQAIIQAREENDVCNDEAFKSNYKNCLQCAGPDNVAIWQYYGDDLSIAGEKCGLGTSPAGGKQDDVGPAIPAEGGTSPSSTSATLAAGPKATRGASEATGTGVLASPVPTDTTGTGAGEVFKGGLLGVLLAVACAVGLMP